MEYYRRHLPTPHPHLRRNHQSLPTHRKLLPNLEPFRIPQPVKRSTPSGIIRLQSPGEHQSRRYALLFRTAGGGYRGDVYYRTARERREVTIRKAYADFRKAPEDIRKACANFRKVYANFRKAPAYFRKACANFRKAPANIRKAYANFRKAYANFGKAYANFRKVYANFRRVPAIIRKTPASFGEVSANIRKTLAIIMKACSCYCQAISGIDTRGMSNYR